MCLEHLSIRNTENYYDLYQSGGVWVSTALLIGRSWDRFPVMSVGMFSVATEGSMCPGVDSASKNDYRGFLLGVKAAGA